jgi:hypothetical protein
MTTSAAIRSSWLTRLQQAAVDFVSRPATAKPLAALRIGLSTVLLAQALAFGGSVLDLFAPSHGVMQSSLTELMLVPGVPRTRWVVELLAPLGISEAACVRGLFVLYVAGLSALLLGWHTRLAAVTAWLTHLILMMSGRASLYGVDEFAHIFLFYLMWMPAGAYWSLDVLSGRTSSAATFAARLGLRVLQIHLCVVYLTSGLEKALTPPYQWLDGEVIWRTSILPDYRQFDLEWLVNVPFLVKLASWGALAIELAYAFLVWPRRTRTLMALSTLGLHLGIAVLMGLVSFGAVMMVLTGSVWLFSPEVESKPSLGGGRETA